VFCTAALSQQAHQHPQPAMVDGSVHPELIPDLTAYRLWLVSVSRGSNPTENEVKHQSAQIARVRIGDEDRKTLISTLTTFRLQYQNLIQSFNAEATAAWAKGDAPNVAAFQLRRDQLVQSIHDALKANLSANAWETLDGHIKGEKSQMKISAGVTQ
jgi:hypothetical protein